MARASCKKAERWDIESDPWKMPLTKKNRYINPAFSYGSRRLMLITSGWLRHAIAGTLHKEFGPVRKSWEDAADAGTGNVFIEYWGSLDGFQGEEIGPNVPQNVARIIANGRRVLFSMLECAVTNDINGVLHCIADQVTLEESQMPGRSFEKFDGGKACDIVRDVVCNPYRPQSLDTAWLTPAVTNIAHAIYEERCFEDLPVLGDALEDAGAAEWILEHCRNAKIYVPGCYVVDTIRRMSGTEIPE